MHLEGGFQKKTRNFHNFSSKVQQFIKPAEQVFRSSQPHKITTSVCTNYVHSVTASTKTISVSASLSSKLQSLSLRKVTETAGSTSVIELDFRWILYKLFTGQSPASTSEE